MIIHWRKRNTEKNIENSKILSYGWIELVIQLLCKSAMVHMNSYNRLVFGLKKNDVVLIEISIGNIEERQRAKKVGNHKREDKQKNQALVYSQNFQCSSYLFLFNWVTETILSISCYYKWRKRFRSVNEERSHNMRYVQKRERMNEWRKR